MNIPLVKSGDSIEASTHNEIVNQLEKLNSPAGHSLTVHAGSNGLQIANHRFFCVRGIVTDRVVENGVTRLDLIQCEHTDGSIQTEMEFVTATEKLYDIGDSIWFYRPDNGSGLTYNGNDVLYRILDEGQNIGFIVCNGPDGEPDFSDARYWVQVCSTVNQPVDDEPGLVEMQQGSSPTPIIVAMTNIAELGCQSHLALPGTAVMLSWIREQAAAGSGSGPDAAAPGPVQWVTPYVDQTKCNRNPCLPPSSSSSSSGSGSSSSSGCGGNAGCINDIGQSLQNGGVNFVGPANMGYTVSLPTGFTAQYGAGGQTTNASGDGFFNILWTAGPAGEFQANLIFANGTTCAWSFETGCNNSGSSGTGSTGSGSGSCNCEWEEVTVVTSVSCVNGQLSVTTSTVKVLV